MVLAVVSAKDRKTNNRTFCVRVQAFSSTPLPYDPMVSVV
jgi:hypothetical protein